MTREEKNAKQRAYRKKHNGRHDKRYEKTPSGFLMRTYRNMQSRVTGVQNKKAHLYKGLSLLSREEFYGWADHHPDFLRLFNDWANSGHDRKLTPSINLKDASLGYELSNMEWITHSENSRRTRGRVK